MGSIYLLYVLEYGNQENFTEIWDLNKIKNLISI